MSAPLTPQEIARLNAALGDRQRADWQPQLELTKLFMRCGPRARREFLQDVRTAQPELFAEIKEGRP